jgi:hypothetical protein
MASAEATCLKYHDTSALSVENQHKILEKDIGKF